MSTTALGFGIVFVATLFSAFGPIFMKKGAKDFSLNPFKLVKNYAAIAGCGFFGFSAIIFVIGLRFGELSVLYPITSLSYIWACLLSVKYLKEKMNRTKWLGMAAIVIGVILIGLGRAV